MHSILRRSLSAMHAVPTFTAAGTLLVILLFPGPLQAKMTTWTDAAASDHNWSTAANWDNGAPVSGDQVRFSAIGGTSTQNIAGLILDDLDMTGYTGTLVVAQPLNVSADAVLAGSVDASFGMLNVAADLTVNGTLTATGAAITIGGGMTVSGTLHANGATIDVAAALTGTSGAVLDMGACTLRVSGDVTLADVASTTWSGGQLTLAGSGTRTVSLGPGSATLPDVTVDRAAASTTDLSDGTTVTFAGVCAVSGGTLSLSAADVDFQGPVSVGTNGTLSGAAAGGHVAFDAGVGISGAFTFSQPSVELTFPAGTTVTVQSGATFAVSGDAVDPAVLHDDGIAGGAQWVLSYADPTDITVTDAQVQDSDAQGPGPVVATSSTDLGNNTNWDFGGPKTTTWTDAAAGNSNWSDDLNWDRGAPGDGDHVLFSAIGGNSVQDIAGLTLGDLDMTGYTGALTLTQPLVASTDARLCGIVDAGNGTIQVGGALDVVDSLAAQGAAIQVGDLTVEGSLAGDGAQIDVSGSFTTGGYSSVIMGSGQLTVDGPALSVVGGLHWTTGKLVLAGSGTQQITLSLNASALHDVRVDRASTSDVTGLAQYGARRAQSAGAGPPDRAIAPGPIVINGTLEIVSGTLSLTGGDVTFSGAALVDPAGVFRDDTAPGIKVAFGGRVAVDGTFSVTATGVDMAFGTADSVVVSSAGTFDITGGTGADRVTLEQDGTPGGAQWILAIRTGATTTFENVVIVDSDASPGETAVTTGDAVDGGNNINWQFGPTAVGDSPPALVLALEAAPNPFNPSTTVHYIVPRAGTTTLVIYDVEGRVVRTLFAGHRNAAAYAITWDGRNERGETVASGAYFCRLRTPAGSTVRKLVLLK